MAIINYNIDYGTIPNSSNGRRGENLTAPGSLKTGIDEKALYRSDTQTRDQFLDHLGTPNPAWSYFHQGSTRGEWDVHPQPYINKYKICEIAVNTGGIPGRWISPNSSNFGNWRTRSAIKVDPHILLMTDSQTFSGGYSHDIGKAFDGMKPGFLNQVEGALEMARLVSGNANTADGGKFVSMYREVPVWNGTTPNSMSDLKFHFEFGMSGIYSGEHEVVRPIFAIASQFTPYSANGNYLKGPAPTDAVYFMEMVTALAGSGGAIVESIKTGVTEVMNADGFAAKASGVVNTATEIQQKIYAAIDTGIQRGAGHGLMSIHVRYGRFVTGPYFVKNINWELDFSEVDEYGFPYKGTLTLGGLQSLWVTTSADFVNSFNAGG